MKRTGIWLDKRKAHIVSFYDSKESFNTILSNVENFNVSGGSGTRFKGGPQDVVQDSKYLERKKHQLKRYFETLVSDIKNANEIVIFGPAETAEKFYKELSEKHHDLFTKVLDVVKSDSMTKKQVKAWVRDFYNIKKVKSV
jgi:stalled ribosome rescue protein Dom34